MRISAWYALTIGAAVTLVAGCGGPQFPVGGPGTMPQNGVSIRGGTGLSKLWLTSGRSNPNVDQYKTTRPLLYVTNVSYGNVTVYRASAKDPAPTATISDGIDVPAGDCIDSGGTLYVANEPASNGGWISEYPFGKTKPSAFIKDGISTAAYCAVDSSGNLWVTNIGGPNVTEYLHGSKKPHTVITHGLVYPVGIAIDRSGNLYVANRPVSGSPNVVVYAPGSKTPTRTITVGVTYPVGIGVDSQSVLYVTNATANNVEEYRPGRNRPYRAITRAMDLPVAVVLNAAGWLYVANGGNSHVVEFRPGSKRPSRHEISKGMRAPNGVAYFPPLIP